MLSPNFYVFLLSSVVHSQSSIALNRLCNSQVNCRECIIANPSCEWCADTVSFYITLQRTVKKKITKKKKMIFIGLLIGMGYAHSIKCVNYCDDHHPLFLIAGI